MLPPYRKVCLHRKAWGSGWGSYRITLPTYPILYGIYKIAHVWWNQCPEHNSQMPHNTEGKQSYTGFLCPPASPLSNGQTETDASAVEGKASRTCASLKLPFPKQVGKQRQGPLKTRLSLKKLRGTEDLY